MTARLAPTGGAMRTVAWQSTAPAQRSGLRSDGYSDPFVYAAYTDQFALGQQLLDTHFADWDLADDDDEIIPSPQTADAIWARIDLIREELSQLELALLNRAAVAA